MRRSLNKLVDMALSIIFVVTACWLFLLACLAVVALILVIAPIRIASWAITTLIDRSEK